MKSSVYFFTDFHFTEKYVVDDKKIDSICNIITNDINVYIYFVISGDIAYSGKAVEYEAFLVFIDTIRKKCKKVINIITCPGNHDINNNNEDYSLDSLIDDTKDINIDSSYKKRISKLSAYKAFENDNISFTVDDDYLSHIVFNCDDKEIKFYSLNNVLFSCFGKDNSSDKTRGHAYLRENTINKIKKNNSNQIVFLVMHFPIRFFSENSIDKLKKRISLQVDILLNGHLHRNEEEILINKGNILLIQGNCFSKNNIDNDDSSFIKIDFNKNEYYEFKWEDDCYVCQNEIRKIDYNSSQYNSHGISFDDDYKTSLSKLEICNRKFNINDIYVFPYLCQEKYDEYEKNEKIVKDFFSFMLKMKKKPISFVYSEDENEIKMFSNYLVLSFFKNDYVPIFANYEAIEKANNVESLIKTQLKAMYKEPKKVISKYKYEIENKNKILVIASDYEIDNEILLKLKQYFSQIVVVLKSSERELIKKPLFIDDEPINKYVIQPMTISKRKEYAYKLYDTLSNSGEKASISKEKFFELIEKQLNTFVVNDICDSLSFIQIIINVYHSTDVFDNSLYSSVNQAKSLLLLHNAIINSGFFASIESVERIISYIAYKLFSNGNQTFTSTEIKESIEKEKEVYGDSKINVEQFCNMVQEAFIVKEINAQDYSFYNRDIFSYYIARYIENQISDGYKEEFEGLLEKDIFIPLHFNIIMCLASMHKNKAIPNRIIDMISNESLDMSELDEKNFSISGITVEKKEVLKRLTQEDIDDIYEKQDRIERKKHTEYIKNKNNFYYSDSVSKQTKEIVAWLDKLKICCILLKNFSSSLKKDYKEKLVELIVSLPNKILYMFNDYIFKELDNMYAILKRESSRNPIVSSIDSFNNFIISIKRSFILSTYDYGFRCFTDSVCNDLLESFLENRKGELNEVQNLMLKSFLIKDESFINSCMLILNNKNYKDYSFIKTSARLIGRRYIAENFELCNSRYKNFVNLIFDSPKEAIKYINIENKRK